MSWKNKSWGKFFIIFGLVIIIFLIYKLYQEYSPDFIDFFSGKSGEKDFVSDVRHHRLIAGIFLFCLMMLMCAIPGLPA